MEKKIEKAVLAIFLIVLMLYGFVYNKAYRYVDEVIDSVVADIKTLNGKERDKDANGNDVPDFSVVSSQLNSGLLFKQDMVDINGTIAKNLGLREIYKDAGGVVLKNGYVAGIYDYTSTDYEVEQIKGLKEFLDGRGIDLLYVNQPTKYFDDKYIEEDLGVKTYVNDNADRFLSRLDEAGINYIDLREHFLEDKSFEYFYKGDHHWTVPAGKQAAEIIMKELNYEYGYDIDMSLYDDEKFEYVKYEDAWLGEQGRKLGETYVGMDDYISVIPKYFTSFAEEIQGIVYRGTFEEVLVDTSLYSSENSMDQFITWHYSYRGNYGTIYNNNIQSGKKILVLGDSFAAVTNTFLALGVSEVKGIVLRDYNGSIREYIESTEYDMVIIAYLQSMIGAHDDTTSANYKLFDFR